MRLFNKTFFRYLLSFGVLLVVSLLFLMATNHFFYDLPGEDEFAPQATCMTSSGEPC